MLRHLLLLLEGLVRPVARYILFHNLHLLVLWGGLGKGGSGKLTTWRGRPPRSHCSGDFLLRLWLLLLMLLLLLLAAVLLLLGEWLLTALSATPTLANRFN